MAKRAVTPTVGVCATCPWRVSNQGQRHAAHWYTLKNLRRLWNGVKLGDAPGMVCHSTDPESKHYGATKDVPATARPSECGGLLLLVFRHVKAAGDTKPLEYRRQFPKTWLRPAAIARWVERHLLGGISGNPIPKVTFSGQPDEIGHPDERPEA